MAEPNQFLDTHSKIDPLPPSISDFLRIYISIVVLCIDIIALLLQHADNSLSSHMRGWREFKRIAKVLLAPELIIVQAFTRISDAIEDLQAVRELDGQDWDLGLAFMANSGRINLRDDSGRSVTLPRPVHLLASPQAHLWKPIIKIIRQSTTTSGRSGGDGDGVVFMTFVALLLMLGCIELYMHIAEISAFLSQFIIIFGVISFLQIHTLTVTFCTFAAYSISWW